MKNLLRKSLAFTALGMFLYGCSGGGSSSGASPAINATVSGPSIAISWTATTGTQTSFSIEQSTDDVTFTAVQTPTGTARTATITGLSSGTYYYRIKAINSAGVVAVLIRGERDD